VYGFFKNIVLKNNLFFYLIAGLGLTLVVIGVAEINHKETSFVKSPPPESSSNVLTASTGPDTTAPADIDRDKKIYIDIQGAVNSPGVYELKPGQRISDAIAIAGELSPKADKKWVSQNINRAVVLQDGDKIYIPALGETSPPAQLPTSPQPSISTDSYLGYLPNSSTAPTNATKSSEPHIVGDVKISLNRATSSELESLPGIGPVRAQKIIQGRPYQKTEDLVERKIIYRSLYDKIKDQIAL
jgi:competence protein ComEA